jgi:hypothetical protein
MYNDFFINGFVSGTIAMDAAFIFNGFEFPSCDNDDPTPVINQSAKKLLDIIHNYIAQTYVSKLFTHFSIGENSMWSGVDGMSADWHNDGREGFNSNFLIYLDNGEAYGNKIEVKNSAEEFVIFPKKNQFVWLNQSSGFLHKATHVSGPRRVLSFEFNIQGLT